MNSNDKCCEGFFQGFQDFDLPFGAPQVQKVEKNTKPFPITMQRD